MLPSVQTFSVTAVSLAAVLTLVVICARVIRWSRTGRVSAGRRLLLIETLPLDRMRRLQIVRCDGRELLLLTGGGADLVLDPAGASSTPSIVP